MLDFNPRELKYVNLDIWIDIREIVHIVLENPIVVRINGINILRLYFFLILILGLLLPEGISQAKVKQPLKNSIFRLGGLERADTTIQTIYLAFTGHDYSDGGNIIKKILKKNSIKAHFFFTGDFYRNKKNKKLINELLRQGHYLGPHSDKHLLYATWEDRNVLIVSKEEFISDVSKNYEIMATFGISKVEGRFFMPPYEWYNQHISNWSYEYGIHLVNFSPGTRSNADYTTPDMGTRYIDSDKIYTSIFDYEASSSSGLNGFILLVHIGTHPSRTDKFYLRLPSLIQDLKSKGYKFGLLSDLY